MIIGIVREGKVPPDKRVPFTPKQCAAIEDIYSDVQVIVQESPVRAFADDEYRAAGLEVVADLQDCDVIMGVKEVPIDMLLSGKKYFFFSHTIKEQPYNRGLLQAILEKNIELIDYETIADKSGARLIGFGKYAGIVGCYNAFIGWGKKLGTYALKRANRCADRLELEAELSKISLPNNFKLALTGTGRVGNGAREILQKMNMKEVSPTDFLQLRFEEPVFTVLGVEDYYERIDGKAWTREDFFRDPSGFQSTFMQYGSVADMYIACHFWSSEAPFIFTREDAKSPSWKIQFVADISCDIDGPVASTLRPSTVASPFYGYDAAGEKEVDFLAPGCIGVMAVDNLPCELPKDASEDFGNELLRNVLPSLLAEDAEEIMERATITRNGKLTEPFKYLQDYVDGVGE